MVDLLPALSDITACRKSITRGKKHTHNLTISEKQVQDNVTMEIIGGEVLEMIF